MDKSEQMELYARRIMELARDTLTIKFRFFDAALARLKLTPKPGLLGFAVDAGNIYYDPGYLLLLYVDEENIAVRAMLHMLLHNVFLHRELGERTNADYWNKACDIAVENIILEMNLPAASLSRDGEEREWIAKIHKWEPKISAQRLYKDFLVNGMSRAAAEDFERLFMVDVHDAWQTPKAGDEIIISEEEWKKISKRIQTDIKTFSKDKVGSDSLEANLDESNRKKYDYARILSQFMTSGEEMSVSDNEFDYIYYTYGLNLYRNMPLIEPVEYKEVKKIRDFAIVIDTSASCRKELVGSFLAQTRQILKSRDTFFSEANIHIIQCDAGVRSDTVVTNDAEFDAFIKNGKLTGFGATDFRPAFEYVREKKETGEFVNFKGLIYFTDGYGIYPGKAPGFDAIFAFLGEDENRPPVPPWAIKVVIEEED